MAGADGIVAVRFHQLDPAFLGAVNRRGAERPVVMVQAAAE